MSVASKRIVRFYVLPEGADVERRIELMCTLVERAAQEKLSVLILCTDDDMLQAVDERLWSFKPESFIPHCRLNDELADKAQVWLAVPPERATKADVLINLSLETALDIPNGCNRIFEIVTQQPDVLQATRTRFAAYRQRGLTPETHKL